MIDAFLDERRRELVEFACELVAAPSPNPPGDERAVASLVAERLRALGIDDVRIAARAPERPNVLASVPGRGAGPTLILSGHLDTKPPGDLAAWRTPPWEPALSDGTLTGLGAADMKSAIAAMVYAAGAVADTGAPGALQLVLTADEEAGGAYGARWLAEEGRLAGDAALIGEPSGITRDWEAIHLLSRGVAIFTVRVFGTQLHSSLSDLLPAVNANTHMARLIARMDRERRSLVAYDPHPLVPTGPTVNVALVVGGGVGYGVHPGEGEFLSDVRALPGMTAEQIEADVRAFLAAAEAEEPDLRTEFELVHWTPPCEIDAGHPLVKILIEAAEAVLGRAPPLAAFPGGTDAPFFRLHAGIPTVPSFGPGLLPQAHAPNESVTVDSLVEAARIYARAATSFLDADSDR